MEELFSVWKYMGTSRRSHRRFPQQMSRSNSRWWMQRETHSSTGEGFKNVPGLQWNYHNAARCIASDLSWFAVRPLWDSVIPPPPPPPSEEELISAGLGSFLKNCLTVTGGGCRVNAPVNLKLFLGTSPAFSAQWRKYRSSLRRVISPDACSEPNAA